MQGYFFLHFLLAYTYFYFKAVMKNLKAKKKKNVTHLRIPS